MTHSARQTAAEVEGVEREIVERKAHRGRLWNFFGSDQFLRGMWESFYPQESMGREDVAPRRSMRILIAMPKYHRGQKKAKLTLFFF